MDKREHQAICRATRSLGKLYLQTKDVIKWLKVIDSVKPLHGKPLLLGRAIDTLTELQSGLYHTRKNLKELTQQEKDKRL